MKIKVQKISVLVALSLSICLLTSCNQVTRTFGGDQTINLEPGQKLENITWKESNLWILSRSMREGEKPENWKFKEHSNFGNFEGTVLIHESSENSKSSD